MNAAHPNNRSKTTIHAISEQPLALERTRYAMALKAILALPPEARILEIGCGSGRMLRTLDALGYQNVVGIDPDQRRLDAIARRGGTRATLICSDRIPFEDDSFDAVISTGVIQHQSDPAAWMQQVQRIVVPGGIIAITGESYMWKWLKKLGMARASDAITCAIWPRKLTATAEAAGLETIACGGFINVPDQRYYFLKQLLHYASPRRRFKLWRSGKDKQNKPITVYGHLDEVPGILDAIEHQPLLTQKRFWSAIFSYENVFYFRKPAHFTMTLAPAGTAVQTPSPLRKAA